MPFSRLEAWLNAVATASPPHDIHPKFLAFAPATLAPRDACLFASMAARSGLARRFSVLAPDPRPDRIDAGGFYRRGRFPGTAARMERYEAEALPLATQAVDRLAETEGPGWSAGISHLILTSCTGFMAPGLDAALAARLGLDPSVERTTVGFMGCNAAFNALKLGRHIIRSDPRARVLLVNVELCTLHYRETADLEEALAFLLFADGASAALVTAERRGLALDRFAVTLLPEGCDLITWHIRDHGFAMRLSGAVPAAISRHLPEHAAGILDQRPVSAIDLWAVHPGGRSVLDAVGASLALPPEALDTSRSVLAERGNMSSVTIMAVLERLLAGPAATTPATGIALGFGPGLSIESLAFRRAA
jgi:alpha-pyrone synthase